MPTLFKTRETVAMDTPASRATSLIVGVEGILNHLMKSEEKVYLDYNIERMKVKESRIGLICNEVYIKVTKNEVERCIK